MVFKRTLRKKQTVFWMILIEESWMFSKIGLGDTFRSLKGEKVVYFFSLFQLNIWVFLKKMNLRQ